MLECKGLQIVDVASNYHPSTIYNRGSRILNTGLQKVDVASTYLPQLFAIVDPGIRILNAGSCFQDPESRIVNS